MRGTKLASNSDEKPLRKGFTTGACAQAAAKACALMLVHQRQIDSVEVELPNKERAAFALTAQEFSEDYARCAVIKDAGDDNDVTHGIEILCAIKKTDSPGIEIRGSAGVGIVTKPGLPVPVGEYAVNPAPRSMILRDVSDIVNKEYGYVVEISVPKGEAVASKTFNPRLGIKGGISIIGTTGIVEPKSQDAYRATLSMELDVAKASGNKNIFLASGYIGKRLLKEDYGIDDEAIIKIGDHVGFMLTECASRDFSRIMLIGHIGKLAKVAAGIFNTHCMFGDARMETIAAYAASCGAAPDLTEKILTLETAEQSVALLRENDLLPAFSKIAQRVVERSIEYMKSDVNLSGVILSLSGEIIGAYPADLMERKAWERFTS